MESLTGIVAFVQAAEQQSYVAAARITGASPSAVGKAVARLEGRLGVRLFNRTTRSMSLTKEGAVFYERCKRIIDDLGDAEATILQSRDQPVGRLRVSMPHIVGHHLFMPILPSFVEVFHKSNWTSISRIGWSISLPKAWMSLSAAVNWPIAD